LKVRVSIRDESGACRIDFSASYFSDPNYSVQREGACVASFLTYCAFGGSAGTFGMYSNVANGGDGGNDFNGHYIGSFGVDSIPLESSLLPTMQPTVLAASKRPSVQPVSTSSPTSTLQLQPTSIPTNILQIKPTSYPTNILQIKPTYSPTSSLQIKPTCCPTTILPTFCPTSIPQFKPSSNPTNILQLKPTFSPTSILSAYAFFDIFDNPNYQMGSRPIGWYCSPVSDCSFAMLEPYNALKPVTSPTRTPYMHFIQWGTAMVAYQYDGTSFLIPELRYLKHYTTRMTFSVARTNGYSLIGTLLHLSDYSNFVQAVIIPSNGNFRLLGQWNGQPYYGMEIGITPDAGEPTSNTAFDLGEFWSMDVSTQPAGDVYCSSMLKVGVSIRNESGACRIDFSASYFSDPNYSVQREGACVASFLTYCAFGGSAGTFGMYSSVANGGDGGNDFNGHYIGSFGVDSVPLI